MVRAAPVIYLASFLIRMVRAYELILYVWYHESWRDLTKSNLFERDSNGPHMCVSTNCFLLCRIQLARLQGEGKEAGWPTKKTTHTKNTNKKTIWDTKNAVFLCVKWFLFVNQKKTKKKQSGGKENMCFHSVCAFTN